MPPRPGEHCIQIDAFYLIWVARKYGLETQFIGLADRINTSYDYHWIEKHASLVVDTRGAMRNVADGSNVRTA